jgi:hypothetical protein
MSEEEWEEWISDPLVLEKGGEVLLRREWVDILFEKYVFPALKTKGFQILGKPDTIMRRFLWFWRHLSKCKYNTSDPLPQPIVSESLTRPVREYFDIFFNYFNSSYFEYLTDQLGANNGGFDDTYLGRRLLAELPYFLWSFIDLGKSPEFVKHENICGEYDMAIRQIEESEMTIEEMDRRRMKKKSGYDPDYVYDKHN